MLAKTPEMPFEIPSDVDVVETWVFKGMVAIFTGIIVYLLKEWASSRKEHKNDLKNHTEQIISISETKTNKVISSLEKRDAKLESTTNTLKDLVHAMLSQKK